MSPAYWILEHLNIDNISIKDKTKRRQQAGAELGQAQIKLELGFTQLIFAALNLQFNFQ